MLVLTREMLANRLFDLKDLTSSYASQEPWFIDKVVSWVGSVEEALLRVRHPMAGFVSVQRANVLAARDGYRPPGNHLVAVSQRKAERVGAIVAMGEVQAALQAIVEDTDSRLRELREKIVQLLAVASATAPIPWPDGRDRNEWLRAVWTGVGLSPETRSMYNYLNAATTQTDIMALLDDVLENLVSADADDIQLTRST